MKLERLALEELASKEAGIAVLSGTLPPADAAYRTLRFATRTGALVRIDGIARGAFDGEHQTIVLSGHLTGALTLEVERRSLPVRGLPPGDGIRWRRLVARSVQIPGTAIESRTRDVFASARPPSPRPGLALVGHSHLDVAWLWTYEEAARKALRTFATAVRQLELDPSFIFTQSQAQLYAYVRASDPALFGRVANLARVGRFDASGAAMWVEADCNLASGEALLRQLVFGIRFAQTHLGVTPTVAWLPDSFGFPNTLPTLLRHADVGAFGTTKLGWNDTTRFPHARFWWSGPDGSRVIAASIASIAGGFSPSRIRDARARGDLLLVGEGDGGGGVSDGALERAHRYGTWTTLGAWFAALARDGADLPDVRSELYLQEHRGVATTHHDVKARGAALERSLAATETLLAWAYALRATPFFLDEARGQLDAAWERVLRAQFHDVLPGTSVAAVYAGVFAEYDEADALVAHVAASARSVLPTAHRRLTPRAVAPASHRGAFVFENDALRAVVRANGTLDALAVRGGPNLVRAANRLALYVDRPHRYDAWNVDRSYRSRPLRVRATGCDVVDGGLEVRFAFGASLAVARYSLEPSEPFLRVEYAIAWNERHALLRSETELAFRAERARFGSPHGAVERAPGPRTAAERAAFEAPGQRFARLDRANAGGVAIFALDTYGWSCAVRRGRSQIGHSLLRGPTWPNPDADLGEHAISLAFAPFETLGMGELETRWERFSGEPAVPMFVPDDARVAVVATKLADDGRDVIVRARECDGASVDVAFACGARVLGASSVDALERPVAGDAAIVDGELRARFSPHALRSFRVRLR